MSLIPLGIYVSLITAYDSVDILMIILGWIILLCSYAIVTIHNDISDIKIDQANKRRDTPIALGVLATRDARKALIVASVIGALAAYLIDPLALLWLLTYVFFGWLYSGPPALKNRGYLALILLAICYGIMPWLIGVIAAETLITSQIMAAIIASFLYVFGIISLKDFKDHDGDRKYGKLTILVQKGPKYTQRMMVLATATAYSVLVLFNYLQEQTLLIVCGLILLVFNSAVLLSNMILSDYNFRRRLGKILRLLFFMYAIITAVQNY